MDPFRKNNGIDVVKASSSIRDSASSTTPAIDRLFTSYPNINTTYSPSETEEPTPTVAPPAYHTIVDPTMPMPNITSPYDPLLQEEVDANNHETDGDTPEITINAATQIRGHGNIISIAQMDSVRIANLISTVLTGDDTRSPCPRCSDAASNASNVGDGPITPHTPTTREHRSTTCVRGVKRWCNINITVNCGATIIGDRNIVGPGLGDIARQMQIAQRNQAALLAQQRAATVAAEMAGQGMKMPSPSFPVQPVTTGMGVATPPMSRTCSLNSEGGMGMGSLKRKVEEGGEGVAGKRRC